MAPNTRNKQQTKKSKTAPKRKQPVKPNPAAVPPPSVNQRFYKEQAKDHFKDIKHFQVIQERGFNLRKLLANPEFEQVITQRG
jgi:hypothetical protein